MSLDRKSIQKFSTISGLVTDRIRVIAADSSVLLSEVQTQVTRHAYVALT